MESEAAMTARLSFVGAVFVLAANLRADSLSFRESQVCASGCGLTSVTLDFGGAAWFTEIEANKVGRFVPGEVVQEFTIPTSNSGPSHIAEIGTPVGAEIWFTESRTGKIGRRTLSNFVGEIELPSAAATPIGIVNAGVQIVSTQPAVRTVLVAFVAEFSANKIARVFSDGTVTEFSIPTPGSGPWGITRFVSLDSSEIWFTESSAGKIGKLDEASGTVTEYTIPTPDSGPRGIVAAIDGNIWFTEYNAGRIGRITRSGVITEYSTSSSGTHPLEIAADQEGDIWFTEQSAEKVGILTADSRVRELALPTSNAGPTGIALGRPSFITHFPPPTHLTAIVGEATPGQVAVATNDWVVVPGVGFADDWETELRFSNRERFAVTFQVFAPFGAARSFSVPPSGSLTLLASSLLTQPGWSTWIVNPDSFFLPSIQARVFQKSRPQVSGVLPSIRQSTLLDLSPDVSLLFGSTPISPRSKQSLSCRPGRVQRTGGMLESCG
jgi:virginiamycin B lyase